MCVSDQHQSAPSVVITTIKNSCGLRRVLCTQAATLVPLALSVSVFLPVYDFL